jgi:hypothetical protein
MAEQSAPLARGSRGNRVGNHIGGGNRASTWQVRRARDDAGGAGLEDRFVLVLGLLQRGA